MGEMIIVLIVVILITGTFGFFMGKMAAGNLRGLLQKHSAAVRVFLLGYIVFAGCFTFPIRSDPFPLDFSKTYLIAASYGIIGLGFAGIYGVGRERFVCAASLLLTLAGMACRYVLEYGEVSNTYNFTVLNIVSYLVIIPAYTVIAYHLIIKFLTKKRG